MISREDFEKLTKDEKYLAMYEGLLECSAIMKGCKVSELEYTSIGSLCQPARSELSGTYIDNMINNSRDMTKEEQKIWTEMEDEISEVVEI